MVRTAVENCHLVDIKCCIVVFRTAYEHCYIVKHNAIAVMFPALVVKFFVRTLELTRTFTLLTSIVIVRTAQGNCYVVDINWHIVDVRKAH